MWADLTPAQRAAAGRLGWAEASWDEGVELDSCGQWVHLSQARVQDATLLGWDQCVVPRHVPRAMAAISFWVILAYVHAFLRPPWHFLSWSTPIERSIGRAQDGHCFAGDHGTKIGGTDGRQYMDNALPN
eukprot:COSAG01_NODE_4290_length_5170_cov_2.814829_4_plen_130_part_00